MSFAQRIFGRPGMNLPRASAARPCSQPLDRALVNPCTAFGSFNRLRHLPCFLLLVPALPAGAQQSPQITTPPQDQDTCAGRSAIFYVEADGTLPLTFNWFRDGVQVTNGVVSLSTNSSLTVHEVGPPDNGAGFFVVVTNAFGTTPSATVHLHVPPSPIITQQPADQAVPFGGSFSFHVGANLPFLSYQWWFQGSPLTNGPRVFGAQSPDLTIINAQPSDAGYYRAIVQDDCLILDSLSARCDVGQPPQITTQPLNLTVPFRSAVLFSVAANGALFYQWYHNDVPILGAINPTLPLTAVQRPQVGVYHVIVGNGTGVIASDRVQLQIEMTLEGSVIPRQEATDFIDSLTNALLTFVPPPTVISHGVPLLFSTYGATAQSWEINRCGVPPSHSMWLLYYSPRTEPAQVSTEGSDFNTVVAVYTWDGNPNDHPVQIPGACDAGGGFDGGTSLLTFSAQARTDYYIAVDGVGGASGLARLQVGDIIRKLEFNEANGSFRFELAGPYWYSVTLQSATNLNAPWQTLFTIGATNKDYVFGYTNLSAWADSQRFYRTGVNTNSSPP